jgi:PrcB C-terminal
MTTFTRLVLVGLIGAGAASSVLATGDTPWLEITSTTSLLYPRFYTETFRAVRSQKEWTALWQQARSNPSGYPDPASISSPGVDFTKYTVLVAALGTRGSGGYTVTIRNARDDGAVIHVSVLEVRPRGPACAVTTEISYPSTAVLIPRTDRAVRFEMASADLDCTSFRSGVGG